MIKTPLSTVIGGAGIWTPEATIVGSASKTFDQLIKSLFANSEQGFFYDQNDLSTMFQDAAGTIPVTGAGQPVGLILDKSKGLVLGGEMVAVSDINGLPANGSFQFYSMSGKMSQLVAGKAYKITYTISGYSGTDSVGLAGAAPAGVIQQSHSSNGSYSSIQIPTTNGYFVFYTGKASTANFSNISVKELSGNHAYQTVSASRPVLGKHPTSGLRNLVAFNNDPMQSSWVALGFTRTGGKLDSRGTYTAVEFKGKPTGVTTVATKASATDFFTYTVCLKAGSLTVPSILLRNNTTAEILASCYVDIVTGSATSSIGSPPIVKSKPNGFWEVTITSNKAVTLGDNLAGYYGITTTLGYDENTSFTVDYCQIEQGKSATNLQVTTTPFDTTEAGFADTYYLYFDGVDDSLQTSNIDFTSTDKVSLFAGVRKLSDATIGAILSSTGGNGAFEIYHPSIAGNKDYVLSASGSTGVKFVTSTAYVAHHSGVLTAKINIGQDSRSLSVNGTKFQNSTEDLGTGNFGNYSLYIGRRGGTSLPFNGHIYSLIGIGKLTSDRETTAIEKELAKRMGVTLSV